MDVLASSERFKHPLQHTWTYWCLDHEGRKSWEERLVEIGSFSTVEDFWCLFNYVKPRSGRGCSIFKAGIRPTWEDQANVEGGRWIVNLDKSMPQQHLDQAWMEVAMCMIGECFGCNEIICGATINTRKRCSKIGLWLSQASNDDGKVIHIGLKLRELIGSPPSQFITYQRHKDGMVGGKPKYTFYV